MVMAYTRATAICLRFRVKGSSASLKLRTTQRMKIPLPLYGLEATLALKTRRVWVERINLVPLKRSWDGLMERRRIRGAPTSRESLREGLSVGVMGLRNSGGHSTMQLWSAAVSMLKKEVLSLGRR